MSGFFHKVAGHVDKLDAEGLRRHYRALTDQLDFFKSVFEALDEGVAVLSSPLTAYEICGRLHDAGIPGHN